MAAPGAPAFTCDLAERLHVMHLAQGFSSRTVSMRSNSTIPFRCSVTTDNVQVDLRCSHVIITFKCGVTSNRRFGHAKRCLGLQALEPPKIEKPTSPS